MIRVNEIKFRLEEEFNEANIIKKIEQKLRLRTGELLNYKIVRESIDARKKILFSYTIDVATSIDDKLISKGYNAAPAPYVPIYESIDLDQLNRQKRPIIIGFGPAGMFAGLILSKAGLNPIILEQGEPVEERTKSVETFWETGKLNPYSNVQFGEGGAGTFSDGKLTTRIKDNRIEFVIETFIKAGAPEEIRYKNKPHIGTDRLKVVVKEVRKEILKNGGEIHFGHAVESLIIEQNEVRGVVAKALETETLKSYETDQVILAIGHSARTLLNHLHESKVEMEAKPFAIGVRVEHPQVLINASQYGEAHTNSRMSAADYKLTHKSKNGRSIYSFCMCPGGTVVASASEENRLVVNGMSEFARDEYNANSALLVNIEPDDLGGQDNVLVGSAFQRDLEEKAFCSGGGNYSAPSTTVGKFLGERANDKAKQNDNITFYNRFNVSYEQAFAPLQASYKPATKECNLDEILPHFVIEALKEGLEVFGRKIKGFDDPRAIFTAVESRSSSPVRILRNNESLQSYNIKGLYPCGEGSGYAGGITSACVDGIKVSEKVIENKVFE